MINEIKSVIEKHKYHIPVVAMAEILSVMDEAEADCCEYIHVEGVGYCTSGCGGYAHDYMLVSEWGFCPHCGRKIKIMEVE